jgi:hypothetical protein
MGLFDGVYKKFNGLVANAFNNAFGFKPTVDNTQLQGLKTNPDVDETTKNLAMNFFNVGETKEQFIKEIDDIKDFYFTQMIIDRIIEDGLNPSAGKELFKIKVKDTNGERDDTASEFLEEFANKMNLEKIVADIAHDILLYGEYALRLDVVSYQSGEKLKGVINIHDDVDIANVLPVYGDSEIKYFLSVKDKKLQTLQPTEFVYFCLPGNRIKMKLDTLDDKIMHLRMGRSVIYPVLGLLKELKFLEEVVPEHFISKIQKTKLLGVAVPPKTKPSDAIEITKVFQRLVDNTLKRKQMNSSDALLNDIKGKTGDVKIIPMFGDKGSLESIDLGNDDAFDDLAEKILDIRKNIFLTIGLPTSILDEDGSKGEIIKDHIRYTKKLKAIQTAVQEGLKQLFYIHLVNNGFSNYLKEDIEITFLNILNTDDLERLEYIDLMISMLDNFKSFVEDVDGGDYASVNKKELVKFYNVNFESLTGFSLFELNEENKDEE